MLPQAIDAAFVQAVDTAAQLAKTDLLTDMVGEFPELQGIMGGYYARHDGLSNEVAEAIVWLLSETSSYTTGSIVDVTGGR